MKFQCPLCDATVYERVIVTRPSGKPYDTDFYQCGGCSVVFRDKDKFSKQVRLPAGSQFAPVAIHGLSEKLGKS